MRQVIALLCTERFVRYVVVGVSTFLLDLTLLFLIIDLFHVSPVIAAGCSFIIALSINYLLSLRYVFTESQRSVMSTYISFLILGVVGLILVTVLMYIATHVLYWHYLKSRIIIAGIVGVFNYLLNLYVNFQVHMHEKRPR